MLPIGGVKLAKQDYETNAPILRQNFRKHKSRRQVALVETTTTSSAGDASLHVKGSHLLMKMKLLK